MDPKLGSMDPHNDAASEATVLVSSFPSELTLESKDTSIVTQGVDKTQAVSNEIVNGLVVHDEYASQVNEASKDDTSDNQVSDVEYLSTLGVHKKDESSKLAPQGVANEDELDEGPFTSMLNGDLADLPVGFFDPAAEVDANLAINDSHFAMLRDGNGDEGIIARGYDENDNEGGALGRRPSGANGYNSDVDDEVEPNYYPQRIVGGALTLVDHLPLYAPIASPPTAAVNMPRAPPTPTRITRQKAAELSLEAQNRLNDLSAQVAAPAAPAAQLVAPADQLIPKKRRRNERVNAKQLAEERRVWGPDEANDDDEGNADVAPDDDAPLEGANPAAVLLRRPSALAKNYTRQPTARVYGAMNILFDDYLELSAAAKVYMLDPEHPERFECVGTKDSVSPDLVKLKLFNCVKDFLEKEGWGLKLWGNNEELPWPRSENKIITTVTPLLRRMVTNERQRLYAMETRKQKALAAAGGNASGVASSSGIEPSGIVPTGIAPTGNEQARGRQNVDATPANLQPAPRVGAAAIVQPTEEDVEVIQYIVRATEGNFLLREEFTVMRENAKTLAAFKQTITHRLHCGIKDIVFIKMLVPSGLKAANTERAWAKSSDEVVQAIWMGNKVTVQVEFKNIPGPNRE